MNGKKMPRFSDIYRIYLTKVRKNLNQLEKKQKEIKKKLFFDFIFIFLITQIFFLPFGIKCLINDNFLNGIVIIIFGIITAVSLCPPNTELYELKNYRSIIKEYVINDIINAFGCIKYASNKNYIDFDNNVNYSSMISEEELKKSELFPDFNTIEYDNAVYGNYNDIYFTASEIYTYNIGGKNHSLIFNQKNPYSYFKGIVIVFKNRKPTNVTTIVSTKRNFLKNKSLFPSELLLLLILVIAITPFVFSLNSNINNFLIMLIPVIPAAAILLYSYIYNKRHKKFDYSTFKNVSLEFPMFNKKFNIYSSDQIESRYVLTPSFMERFYNLKSLFSAKNIRCAFYDDKLMIAVSTKKDLFELGNIFTPITHKNNVSHFYDEIKSIFNIIDELKIN